MVLIREDILSKFLLLEPEPFEGLYIELSLRRKQWLINCSYNPHINSLPNHLAVKQKRLGVYTSHYDNKILIGEAFWEAYGLKSLIKQPTCFKNPDNQSNPPCIDLIITSNPLRFPNSCVIVHTKRYDRFTKHS